MQFIIPDIVINIVNILIIIIGLLSGIITVMSPIRDKTDDKLKGVQSLLGSIMILVVIIFSLVQYLFVPIPHLKRSDWDSVRRDIRDVGLEYKISNPESYNEEVPDQYIYTLCNEEDGGKYALKGTTICLMVTGRNSSEDGSIDLPEEEAKAIINGETLDGDGTMRLHIDRFSRNNGFYYEYPDSDDESMTCFIEYGPGINGTFSLSRPLTEEEIASMQHSGVLYDSTGKVVDSEDVHPHFWALDNGMFAVEFPEYMEEGEYTYTLTLFIDGQWYSDSVHFQYTKMVKAS